MDAASILTAMKLGSGSLEAYYSFYPTDWLPRTCCDALLVKVSIGAHPLMMMSRYYGLGFVLCFV